MNILLRRNKESIIDILNDMLNQIMLEEQEEQEHLKTSHYWQGSEKEALDNRTWKRKVEKRAINIVLDKIKNPVPSMTTNEYLDIAVKCKKRIEI